MQLIGCDLMDYQILKGELIAGEELVKRAHQRLSKRVGIIEEFLPTFEKGSEDYNEWNEECQELKRVLDGVEL